MECHFPWLVLDSVPEIRNGLKKIEPYMWDYDIVWLCVYLEDSNIPCSLTIKNGVLVEGIDKLY